MDNSLGEHEDGTTLDELLDQAVASLEEVVGRDASEAMQPRRRAKRRIRKSARAHQPLPVQAERAADDEKVGEMLEADSGIGKWVPGKATRQREQRDLRWSRVAAGEKKGSDEVKGVMLEADSGIGTDDWVPGKATRHRWQRELLAAK